MVGGRNMRRRGEQDSHYQGARYSSAAQPAGAHNNLTTSDALTYLREVKNMFCDDRQVYETFLEIMKEFKAQTINTEGVIARVKQLFKGHRDLIFGFNTFLPKGHEIKMEDLIKEEQEEKSKQPVEFDQAINYVNKIKERFRFDEAVYKHFLEILNQYRKGQKGIKEVYDQVANLFRDHSDLLEEFTYFLPDSQAPHKAALERQRRLQEQMAYANKRKRHRDGRPMFDADSYDLEREGSAMFERMRKRLVQSAWQDFLKLLYLFYEEVINETELLDLTHTICQPNATEVFGAFEDFVTRIPSMELLEQSIQSVIHNVTQKNSSLFATKDMYARTPISDLDFSTAERCSPSYVMLPKNYPRLVVSNRDSLPEDFKKLFNDTWVSVTHGSEDFSFRLMRRNQYEEALFRFEDDRYELELLIGRNKSVLQRLKTVNERLEAMDPEARAMAKLESEELNAVQEQHVSQIYGDSGPKILSLINANPSVAIPVVLPRLEQKGSEWQKVVSDMEKYWQRQFDQNYTRSLDHRSFYFKNMDKRNLSNRNIMQELKEASEARRKGHEACLQIHTGATGAIKLAPDLEFEMPDKDVHEDLWRLMSYGSTTHSTLEMAAQIRQFWQSTVGPFFGIPTLASQPEDSAVAVPAGVAGIVAVGANAGAGAAAVIAMTPSTSADIGTSAAGTNAAAAAADADDDASSGSSGIENNRGAAAGTAAAAAAAAAEAAADPLNSLAMIAAGQDLDMQLDLEGGGGAAIAPDAAAGSARGGVRHGGSGGTTTPSSAEGHEGASRRNSHEESEAIDDGMDDDDEEDEEEGAAGRMKDPLRSTTSLPIVPVEERTAISSWEPTPVQAQPPTEMPLQLPVAVTGPKVAHELFCNEHMYCFWRLYSYLYDRLKIARDQLSEKLRKSAEARGVPDASARDKDGENRDGQGGGGNGVTAEEFAAAHRRFIELLLTHVASKQDSSSFEDQLRTMLGQNAYVLFTVNKLVHKIVKQLHNVIADEASVKLINLHHYERRRRVPVNWATRLANACATFTDDTNIRLTSHANGCITVAYLEADRTDIPAVPPDADAQAFLAAFMNVSQDEVFARQQARESPRLFLKRNIDSRIVTDSSHRLARLERLYIRNGLESVLKQDDRSNGREGGNGPLRTKVITTRRFAYKFNFMLDTEDALVRLHHPSDKPSSRRQRRERRVVDAGRRWAAFVSRRSMELPRQGAAVHGVNPMGLAAPAQVANLMGAMAQ